MTCVAKPPGGLVGNKVLLFEGPEDIWRDSNGIAPHENGATRLTTMFGPDGGLQKVRYQSVPALEIRLAHGALRHITDVFPDLRLDPVLRVHVAAELCEARGSPAAHAACMPAALSAGGLDLVRAARIA